MKRLAQALRRLCILIGKVSLILIVMVNGFKIFDKWSSF